MIARQREVHRRCSSRHALLILLSMTSGCGGPSISSFSAPDRVCACHWVTLRWDARGSHAILVSSHDLHAPPQVETGGERSIVMTESATFALRVGTSSQFAVRILTTRAIPALEGEHLIWGELLCRGQRAIAVIDVPESDADSVAKVVAVRSMDGRPLQVAHGKRAATVSAWERGETVFAGDTRNGVWTLERPANSAECPNPASGLRLGIYVDVRCTDGRVAR
jgi:hypothetical protein